MGLAVTHLAINLVGTCLKVEPSNLIGTA